MTNMSSSRKSHRTHHHHHHTHHHHHSQRPRSKRSSAHAPSQRKSAPPSDALADQPAVVHGVAIDELIDSAVDEALGRAWQHHSNLFENTSHRGRRSHALNRDASPVVCACDLFSLLALCYLHRRDSEHSSSEDPLEDSMDDELKSTPGRINSRRKPFPSQPSCGELATHKQDVLKEFGATSDEQQLTAREVKFDLPTKQERQPRTHNTIKERKLAHKEAGHLAHDAPAPAASPGPSQPYAAHQMPADLPISAASRKAAVPNLDMRRVSVGSEALPPRRATTTTTLGAPVPLPAADTQHPIAHAPAVNTERMVWKTILQELQQARAERASHAEAMRAEVARVRKAIAKQAANLEQIIESLGAMNRSLQTQGLSGPQLRYSQMDVPTDRVIPWDDTTDAFDFEDLVTQRGEMSHSRDLSS